MKERIYQKLSQNLDISYLEVVNKSHLHKGHLGDDGSGQTHFDIIISANNFKNKSKILAHREINKILQKEFKEGLHALSIKIINS